MADLDVDGKQGIIVPRGNALEVWHADGGRIWTSLVVADFRDDSKLEIAYASREYLHLLDASGSVLSDFPVTWEDEIRTVVDGDGQLGATMSALPSPVEVTNR